MTRIKISKKRIVGIVIVAILANIAVNIALSAPLASLDYKLVSFEYLEDKSTDEYSFLRIRVLVRNNYWLPAKVDVIRFEIRDEKTGGLCGEGELGPIILDPGQIGLLRMVIKLYRNEATVNFIKEFIKSQKFVGKIKAYYPVSLFGLATILRIPVEVPLEKIIQTGDAPVLSLIPSMYVRDILLTKETDEYAEAKVFVEGTTPAELSQVGKVKIEDAKFNIINNEGYAVGMEINSYTLDPKRGSFQTEVTLRFIKGNALRIFLEKAIKERKLEGKISGKLALEIFGIRIENAKFESDLSAYSSIFASNGTMEKSSLFSSISTLFRDIIGDVDIHYFGTETSYYGKKYNFGIDLSIRNTLNWTIGWEDINIEVYKSGSTNPKICIRVLQPESILVRPKETEEVALNVSFYDNEDLYRIMKDILYRGTTSSMAVSGTIDVYFAGVWIRDINVSSSLGGILGGEQGTQAGMLSGVMPLEGGIGEFVSVENVSVARYNIKATDREVIISTWVNITYERMPISIYNVSASIEYGRSVIGEIWIPKIDLDVETEDGLVVCSPEITITLKKSARNINDFISDFIHGTWQDKVRLSGSLDIKFLGRTYRSVPLLLQGDIFIGNLTQTSSSIGTFDFFVVKNITYVGEGSINGVKTYELLATVDIVNYFDASLGIYSADILVGVKGDNRGFARIQINRPVMIPPYASRETKVSIILYDNGALVEFLNETIRGGYVDTWAYGNLSIDLGGINISVEKFRTEITTSLIESLSSMMSQQSSLYGSNIQILNATEYPDHIEIYVLATREIPIPMKIFDFRANASMNRDSIDPPVSLELVDIVEGPGESNMTVKLILNNLSSEFEDFVRGYVCGDADKLYVDLALDIDVFGHRFSGVILEDISIETSSGGDESIFSAIKFDGMVRLNTFKYEGQTTVSGEEAYKFSASIEITNTIGISFEIWDSVISIIKDNHEIVRIIIDDEYSIPAMASEGINVTIYVFKGVEAMGTFIGELIVDKVFNATISGTISIKVFGVEITEYEIISRICVDLAEQSGLTQYYDLSGMLNADIESISLVNDTENITTIEVVLDVDTDRFPMKMYYTYINLSLPGYNKPAVSIIMDGTIDLEVKGDKEIGIEITLMKYDMDYIREFLRRALESRLYPLNITGIVGMEIFGVNVTLPFSFDSLNMTPTSADVLTAGALPDVALSIESMEYNGEEIINGQKAYVFDVSVGFDNIFDIGVEVGPFIVSIEKDGETVVEMEMGYYEIEPLSKNMINMTILFYGRNETYEFLRELIEENKINCTVRGMANITIYGIDIVNVSITYSLVWDLRNAIVGESSSGLPLDQLEILGLSIDVTEENDEYAEMTISLNTSNTMDIPAKVWNMTMDISKDGILAIHAELVDLIDLSEENVTLRSLVRLYKNNATQSLLEELFTKKISKVDIQAELYFYFLEWNFTLNVSVKDIQYSSEGTVGSVGIPIGVDEIFTIDQLEQKGDKELWIYFTFNNIVNTTIEFGDVEFEVYYLGERVLQGGIDDRYVIEPLGNTTGIIKIVFDDNQNTQEFLEELLVNRTFKANITGDASFAIFGFEFTKIPFAESILVNFADQLSGQQAEMVSIFPVLTGAQIVSSKSYEEYLEINISVMVNNSPLSIRINDLNITFSNKFGDIGQLFIWDANISYMEASTVNITVRLYDKYPNYALEKLIRDVVEEKQLELNITGRMNLNFLGFDIRDIPLDFEIHQSLESDDSGQSQPMSIGVEQFLIFQELKQLTFGEREAYDLNINITARSPIDTLIRIGNLNITVYSRGYRAIDITLSDVYELTYENYINISTSIKVYDSPGTKELLEDYINQGIINVSIVGYTDLYILGAELADLYINYTVCQKVETTEDLAKAAGGITTGVLNYSVEEVHILGENSRVANVSVLVSITDAPIYLEVYSMDLAISNAYGDIARLLVNETAKISPQEESWMKVYITIYRATDALRRFIEEFAKESRTTVDVRGRIEVRLFSNTTEYLLLNISIDLRNITYGGESNESIVPIDFGSMLQFQDMEYIGEEYYGDEGCTGYKLKAISEFINKLNITISIYNMSFKLYRHNETIILGSIPSITIAGGANSTIETYLTILDKPETAEFLSDLLNRYSINVSVEVWVDEIELFGVRIRNISLNQVFGWDISKQVEGSEVQSGVLTLFDMFIGDIVVLGEDEDTARMQFNITVSNARLPVIVTDFIADIYYSGEKVANVGIPSLELNVSRDTNFLVNLTIFKQNKTALRGFLMDLLVHKNVRMDIWGSITVNLFDSHYLILDVSFKYNDTVYSVDDYYGALMSGELDTSSFLDQIVKYDTENLTWSIVEETEDYVILRLNESLWSALNIKILYMRTWLYMDPLNASTIFALQYLVDYVDIPANGTGDICIEIKFFKNEYLQQFLDGVFHDWEIKVWADTIIDLEIFGVNITGLEALSAKFAYVITLGTIQGALDSMVNEQVNSVNADVVYLQPIGYGTWYNSSDLYGGVEEATNYAVEIWNNDPQYIDVWDYYWILIKYVQEIGSYGFNVSLLNFKALMTFTGMYANGTDAKGDDRDFIGEIYIDNLTLLSNANNTFFAYVRLWRVNRFYGLANSSLKDWLWSMVKYHQYNFSIQNVTFDLEMWGCHIRNITLDRLNFTGIYDPSSLSDVIKFRGLKSWSVGWNLNEGVYADVTFEIEVPMSPEWLTYYFMLITWDDDPIFFEDSDSGPDDSPSAGGFSDNGTHKYSEVEEFKALDPDAVPYAHSDSNYYVAPIMKDAPRSLPDYAVWFGTGGNYTLNARLDMEWDDGHHDYFGNIDVDQKYDDESLTSNKQAEQEDANGDAWYLLNWEGIEDGDMWAMVMLSYEVEFLMFWWVVYYYTPMFYITSGDWNPNIENGTIVALSSTVYWELHDYYNVHRIIVMRNETGHLVVKPHPNADYTVDVSVSGLCFFDSYDGSIDTSEPDYSGNYHR